MGMRRLPQEARQTDVLTLASPKSQSFTLLKLKLRERRKIRR
jgi:hypothetical protein